MYLVGLVHGDLSGASGSSCSGRGGHFQPPAPLSRKWRRLLRDPVRAPDSLSCPEEASASELAQEGSCSRGTVLSCVSSPGGLSCPVSLFSPGGLLIPPNFPREIFLGVERVPAVGAGPRRPRPRPQAPPAMASWAPCTAMASRAPCTTMASRAPSSAMASVICSALEVPVLWSCLCLSRGPPERPPPLPGGTVKARDEPFGRGGVMSVLCRVCHVFPPHVSIFGLFPVLVKCHYELIRVQLCLSRYLWFTCVFIVLYIQFDFIWSTRYSRCFLSALSCPVLPCLH